MSSNGSTDPHPPTTSGHNGSSPPWLYLFIVLGITTGVMLLPDGLATRVGTGLAVAVVLADLIIRFAMHRRRSGD